ncbi:alginate lyase [Bacillus sp. SA1-12]|uniref:alginate lyase family protein n=1 Tax=Bacillus sp. SA1-12 TaxID=1455638 RepID=UPI00062708E5|nr:alginate lyase family protein [Bacillus sp. SA1-12]KKI89382.1 alginate lyase [Bacillus sp. SA1-12]
MQLKSREIVNDIFEKERDWILTQANHSLSEKPVHITDAYSDKSPGSIHDYYSNGDYWWPNPHTENGLPYIKRDGQSYPNVFHEHRQILRRMRTNTANLAAGYLLTEKEEYAEIAVLFLKEFFLDEKTRMNPHLLYAQAIPGICTGRGIGIIDTLHLIDIPMAIRAIKPSLALTPDILEGLKRWFSEYLEWMSTHPYGKEEMNAKNNHSVCWYVQAAAFAKFTEDSDMINYCIQQYKSVLIPQQMAEDGSFPLELARTKPYSYSIFVLDNLVTLCHILSSDKDNLWDFQLEDGRSIRKGIEFLFPFLKDKSTWKFDQDIEHFEGWPARVSFLLFAGIATGESEYIKLWKSLDRDPTDQEVRRNIAIRQQVLWL